MMKRYVVGILAAVLVCASACSVGPAPTEEPEETKETKQTETETPPTEETAESTEEQDLRSEDVIVLFTANIGGKADANIGLSGVAALKDACNETAKHVYLADLGDAGSAEAAEQYGGSFVALSMDVIPYDYAVLGDRDLSLGLSGMTGFAETGKIKLLAANIQYAGEDPLISELFETMDIVSAGEKKIAFIGVMMPNPADISLISEETGNAFDFMGADADFLYQILNLYVDDCRMRGADYVVALTHLSEAQGDPFNVYEFIGRTAGIDAVLNGSGETFKKDSVKNSDGKNVLLAGGGKEFEGVGKLTISESGEISADFVTDFSEKDAEIQSMIDALKAR